MSKDFKEWVKGTTGSEHFYSDSFCRLLSLARNTIVSSAKIHYAPITDTYTVSFKYQEGTHPEEPLFCRFRHNADSPSAMTSIAVRAAQLVIQRARTEVNHGDLSC